MDVMLAIWVLSRVGLWVGKLKSSRIIMCLHFRCRNGTSLRSTLHHLSFARLLDSLQSPPRSLIIQKSPVRSITALVVSSACLPRPLYRLAGRSSECPPLVPPPPPPASHALPTPHASLAALLGLPLLLPGRPISSARLSGIEQAQHTFLRGFCHAITECPCLMCSCF